MPKANRIKFSDAEEENELETSPNNLNQKSKTNIFGSDDEDNDEDYGKIQLKAELFAKKGLKLVELQSKQSLDPRFRIDAKFVEDDEDAEDQEQSDTAAKTENSNDEATSELNERSWQMGILEQVVGSKIDTSDNAQKAARKKRMLRYDPSKEEHQKLLRTGNKESPPEADADAQITSGKKKQKKRHAEDEEITVADAGPEVSKEVFYVVTDTLAESLRTRGDGFSLLNMFGSAQMQDKRADELKKVSDAKILINKLDKNALNPFKYDSSSDEEGENEPLKQIAKDGTQKKTKQQNKILMESFFISKNDARLKGKARKSIFLRHFYSISLSFVEGAKFFRYEKKSGPEEDYEAVRNRLKLLIRSKINKTKKNLVANSGGGVGHKKRIKGRH